MIQVPELHQNFLNKFVKVYLRDYFNFLTSGMNGKNLNKIGKRLENILEDIDESE